MKVTLFTQVVAATSLLLGASAVKAEDFFRPAPDLAEALDPQGIYPQGRIFGFGLYSIYGQNLHDPSKTNMQRVAEEGFTLAGPHYDTDPTLDYAAIADAAAVGLKFSYGLRPHESLVGIPLEDRPAAIDAISDEAIYAEIRAQMLGIISDPLRNATVARWALEPEELRYWIPQELRYLRVARESVLRVERETGQQPRPFWMYEENYRNAEALMVTGVYQDLVGKGVYLTGNYADATTAQRGDQRTGFAMWGYTQIIRAADELNATPQAFLQMAGDFTDPLTANNPAEIRKVLRHDTYLALLMGVKSLNIWSMYETRENFTTHNEQFEAYGSVAHDLTGPLNLQELFLFGERRDDLTLTVGAGQETIEYTHTDGTEHTFDALHWANIADKDGRRYLFLINSTEGGMSVRVEDLPTERYGPLRLTDLFGGESLTTQTSGMTITLLPLEVRAFEIVVPEPTSSLFVGVSVLSLLSRGTR